MELDNLGTHAARLLSDQEARSIAVDANALPDVIIEKQRSCDFAITCSLCFTVISLCTLLMYLFVHTWLQETSYRAWLILACVPPLTFAIQNIWAKTLRSWNNMGTLQVKIDSLRATTLFNAVVDRIEQVAESKNETCSSDVESFTQYDKTLGRTQVRMRFWGGQSRKMNLVLAGNRKLVVIFSRGDDVICGRDNAVTTRETLILRMRASWDRIADKKFLQGWLLSCVELFREPPENIVEVMALDQSNTDWIPEWQTRCVRTLKRSDGLGNGFFLKRKSIMPILADASTWCGKELRIYLIIGPPGTGKTELTIWLAGYLRVPLYRLSLNDARLSDQIFAQLISPTSLRHDNAVIQIDEFQETLARWKGGYKEKGVSMGGFCEVLQGSNSLARGFIILSGTQELAETMRDPAFSAVFRRISIAPTMLDWLSTEDLQKFFCHFVLNFVPGCRMEELQNHAKKFTSSSTWGCGKISIDMVKQFLMHRISSFRAAELPDDSPGRDTPFVIPEAMRERFFAHLCEEVSAEDHMKSYPLVERQVSWVGQKRIA